MSVGIANLDVLIDYFGDDYRMAKKGKLKFHCPNECCKDSNYHCEVDPDELIYYCHKCGVGGKVATYSKKGDLIQRFMDKFGNKSYKKTELIPLKDELCQYHLPIYRPVPGMSEYKYLKARDDLTDEVIRFYDIRVGGFGTSLDRRIIVPNIIQNDFTDIYAARVIDPNVKPKYLYPDGVKKSNIVFNLHRIPYDSPRLIITEGVFSSISAGASGVCIYGCHISKQQVQKIMLKQPKKIYVALDNLDLSMRCAEEFEIGQCEVYVVKLPGGKDPNDLGHTKFMKCLNAAVRIN